MGSSKRFLISLFSLLGKIEVLENLGIFYCKLSQTDKAVKYLEKALQQARSFYCDKPHIHIAQVLSSLGSLIDAGKYRESLLCIEEAKQIMDHVLGVKYVHPITSGILFKMGTSYLMLNDLSKAFQCFQDAFDMNLVLYGEDAGNICCGNNEAVCADLAFTAQLLGNFTVARECYVTAIKIKRATALVKNTSSSATHALDIVSCLYYQGGCCEALGERIEALALLEEAKDISTDAGLKDWVVVDVLVELVRKYAQMESIFKSIMCYVEAGQMASRLPKDNYHLPPTLEMLKLMKITAWGYEAADDSSYRLNFDRGKMNELYHHS